MHGIQPVYTRVTSWIWARRHLTSRVTRNWTPSTVSGTVASALLVSVQLQLTSFLAVDRSSGPPSDTDACTDGAPQFSWIVLLALSSAAIQIFLVALTIVCACALPSSGPLMLYQVLAPNAFSIVCERWFLDFLFTHFKALAPHSGHAFVIGAECTISAIYRIPGKNWT